MKIFARLIIILMTLSSAHQAMFGAAAAAAGGGSGSSATAAAAPGGAGAPAALAVAAPSGRRVATSAIVREMFGDRLCTNLVETHHGYDSKALSPLECALRIASLDFDSPEVVSEMIRIIHENAERNALGSSGDFFRYLNALLAAIDYNNNTLLRTAMELASSSKLLPQSLLSRVLPGDKPFQDRVIVALKHVDPILYPDDNTERSVYLHGHEFCAPFLMETARASYTRMWCLEKFLELRPARLGVIGGYNRRNADQVLLQILIVLGSLPQSPKTFAYGERLDQIRVALKSYEDVNVVDPGSNPCNPEFAQRIVDLLKTASSEIATEQLIKVVEGLELPTEEIVDNLQLIVQLSANTDLEFDAYAVFKKVALGFAFGLNQAQIVDVLKTGRLE